jgi:hypothetical protein
MDETLDRAWQVAARLPASELTLLGRDALAAHLPDGAADPPR